MWKIEDGKLIFDKCQNIDLPEINDLLLKANSIYQNILEVDLSLSNYLSVYGVQPSDCVEVKKGLVNSLREIEQKIILLTKSLENARSFSSLHR